MGVGGLTSFVDDNTHLLSDHRLHDTRVVMDGNNLYHFLYCYYGISFRYGGNLDDFADSVVTYFKTLRTCNIEPYVVFDGAYATDDRKLKTVMRRARDKIRQSEAIAKGMRGRLIPPLSYDVFKNVLSELGIPHATCPFEADDEIAALANAWRCPVMSNDSDFFIFDLIGGFIVFDYVNLQVLTSDSRKMAAGEEEEGNTSKTASSVSSDVTPGGYKYLAVQIYQTKNLLDVFPSLDKSMLPLFACLYGNDTVHREYFEAFYQKTNFPAVSNLPAAVWSSPGKKHDRILKLLLWLDDAVSRDVAMESVLRHVRSDTKVNAENVRDVMRSAIESYSIQNGHLMTYFDTGVMPWLGTTGNNSSQPGKSDLGPPWFARAVCQARIPTFVLNAYLFRRALLRCQIEDLKSPSSYKCALELRRIMYSIVCGTVNNVNQSGIEEKGGTESHSGSPSKYSTRRADKVSQSDYVTEYDREGTQYRQLPVELVTSLPSGRPLPDLTCIPDLSHDERLEILLDAFGIDVDLSALDDFPRKWMWVVLTVGYWVRHASPKVNLLHLLSLLTCVVKLGADRCIEGKKKSEKKRRNQGQEKQNGVELQVNSDNDMRPFSNQSRVNSPEEDVQQDERDQGESPTHVNGDTSRACCDASSFNTCESSEGISSRISGRSHFLQEELEKYPLEVLEAARNNLQRFCRESNNSNQFYIQNVHAFAQFQSVYLAALQLNAVLLEVVPVTCPSHVISCSFLYNLYKELHARSDPKLYLAEVLGRSGPLVPVWQRLVEVVTRFLPEGCLATTPRSAGGGKKNRKRKGAGNEARSGSGEGLCDTIEQNASACSSEDAAQLAGNQFALLAIS